MVFNGSYLFTECIGDKTIYLGIFHCPGRATFGWRRTVIRPTYRKSLKPSPVSDIDAVPAHIKTALRGFNLGTHNYRVSSFGLGGNLFLLQDTGSFQGIKLLVLWEYSWFWDDPRISVWDWGFCFKIVNRHATQSSRTSFAEQGHVISSNFTSQRPETSRFCGFWAISLWDFTKRNILFTVD